MIYLLQTVDADARTTVLDLEEAAAAGLSFFCSSAAAMAVLALAATAAELAVVTAVAMAAAMAVLTAAGLSSFFCFSAAATAAELVSDAAMAVVTAVDADANLLQRKLGRQKPSQFSLCNTKMHFENFVPVFSLTFSKKLCRI